MTCSAARTLRALVTLLIPALVLALAAAPLSAKKKRGHDKPTDPDALFNPLLGVDHSRWLVGAIARMASAEEIERYMTLTSDADAAAFIEAFWAQRNKGTPIFKRTPEQIFEARVAQANKRFSEAVIAGSKTDRGTIFVLYGEPANTSHERARTVGGVAPEVWEYSKDAKPGLDGQPPERHYRFIKLGGHTVFFREQMRRDPRLRDPLHRNRSGGFGG